MAQLAVSSNMFAKFSRQESLAMARMIGFECIDVWVSPVFVQHIDFEAEDPETVKTDFKRAGMRPISMSIYFTTLKEKFALLEFAAAAAIPYVTFEVAPRAGFLDHMSNLSVSPDRLLTSPGAGWLAFLDQLTAVLEKAAEVGVRIALQVPHVYTLIERSSDVMKLRKDLDHPALYFVVSPTHTVARGSSLQEMVDVCGDRLAIQHLWNVKKQYTPERDDRSWGTPSEQLSIKGYFDFEKTVAERDRSPVEYLCLKRHGTEGWDSRERVIRTVEAAGGKALFGRMAAK
ncbi:MAG: sugar phosphate isomerase/epimerase, partial [Spirochaetaceae bacterium]|nr:sugar phosphate isomerase/epimerase [Spirochaetaceae bacterium]